MLAVPYGTNETHSLPLVPTYGSVVERGDDYPLIESSPYPLQSPGSGQDAATDAVTAGVAGMSLYSGYTPLSSLPPPTAPPAYGYDSFPPASGGSMGPSVDQPFVDRSTKPAEVSYPSVSQPEVDRSSKPAAPVTRINSLSDVGDLGITFDGGI